MLNKIKEALIDQTPKRCNHRIALWGLGGVGKTQCALEYAYANRVSYERIYWISAVDQSCLLSGYEKIAKHAGLGAKINSLSPTDIAETVLAWLAREKNWLIVIDNLDDVTIAAGLLPENSPENHTLITTRNPYTSSIPAEPLEITPLGVDESIEMLLCLSELPVPQNSAERTEAADIVRTLGYLPLAIKQAAAYVREVAGDLQMFSDEYRNRRKEVLQWPIGNANYPHSVSSTWSLSFRILQMNHPRSVRLLRLFAMLYPDKILIEFLLAGVNVLDKELRRIFLNRNELAKALIELERFSLIKWDRRGGRISLHRLVQSVVRDEMGQEELRSTGKTVTNLCLEVFPSTVTNTTRPICRKYEAQVVEPLLRSDNIDPTLDLYLLKKRVAQFLRADGKYSDGEKMMLQALEIANHFYGLNSYESLNAMESLAWMYGEQGGKENYIQMESLMKVVVEKRRESLGIDHKDTLVALNCLAWTYKQQRRLPEAAAILEVIVPKQKRTLGETHIDTMWSLMNLGVTTLYQGRLEEAEVLLEEVLVKRKQVHGEDSPDIIWPMINLAFTYHRQNRLDEAARSLEQAMTKSTAILGTRHPTTICVKSRLAGVYSAQNRLMEAMEMEKEALDIRSADLIRGDQLIIRSLNNLAAIYEKQGKEQEANMLKQEAFKQQGVHHMSLINREG